MNELDSKTQQSVDHCRWLMNSGLANDTIKNQLITYGAITHPDIQAVELTVDFENKTVFYRLYIDSKLLNKVDKFKELSKATKFWGLYKFKRLLKKEGNLNFNSILDKFIKDYCGLQWKAEVDILNLSEYDDKGYEDSNESVNFSDEKDKPVN